MGWSVRLRYTYAAAKVAHIFERGDASLFCFQKYDVPLVLWCGRALQHEPSGERTSVESHCSPSLHPACSPSTRGNGPEIVFFLPGSLSHIWHKTDRSPKAKHYLLIPLCFFFFFFPDLFKATQQRCGQLGGMTACSWLLRNSGSWQ